MLNFFVETLRLGLKNLWLHKLRSLLTALGIIIGVAAVIIMVAIGEGAKVEALEQIRQLGARNILVRSVRPPESNDASGRMQRVLEYGLKRTDLERLKSLPDLATVVELRDTEQKVVRGDIRANANAIATTADVFDVVNLKLARGRYFTTADCEQRPPAEVCVLGNRTAQQLFPQEDPLGQTVRVGTSGSGMVVLTVVGVLEPTGLRAGSDGASMMNRDLDLDLYFPMSLSRAVFYDTINKRDAGTWVRKNIQLSEIWLKAKEVDDVERIAAMAENVVGIEQKGGTDLSAPPRLDVEVKAPIQILRAAERTQRMFNFIMVSVAGFALAVGGIGIMNIMLATVTERTREVGIRRALGAKRLHITLQFLLETTLISVGAGMMGIMLGIGAAKLLPWIVEYFFDDHKPTAIAVWSVVGSFVASGLIGVGFGLYPAIKAAYMNPIEALRHE